MLAIITVIFILLDYIVVFFTLLFICSRSGAMVFMFYNTSQDELPNERKIVKLCEYAAKNPFRIPKVFIYAWVIYLISFKEDEEDRICSS